jgi:hypothetical protein
VISSRTTPQINAPAPSFANPDTSTNPAESLPFAADRHPKPEAMDDSSYPIPTHLTKHATDQLDPLSRRFLAALPRRGTTGKEGKSTGEKPGTNQG